MNQFLKPKEIIGSMVMEMFGNVLKMIRDSFGRNLPILQILKL
jgi:hypothetical protein